VSVGGGATAMRRIATMVSGNFGAPLGDLAAVAEEFGDPGRGTSATRLPSAQLRGEGGLGGFNHLLKSWASRLT
jgi:hypothetical protein